MKQKQAGFGPVEIILTMLVLTVAIGVGVYTLRAKILHKQAPVDGQIELTKKLYRTFESGDTNYTLSYPEFWRVDNQMVAEQAVYFRKSEFPLPYFKVAESPKSQTRFCDASVANTLNNGQEVTVGAYTGYAYYMQDGNMRMRTSCFERNDKVYFLSYAFEDGEEHLHAVEYEKFIETFTFR